MKLMVLFGRIFYSTIFLNSAFAHFSEQTIGYASAQGVPMASVLVPFSGILAFLGGFSILAGYHAKWGAWLIVLFLVPVTLTMHNFWDITDPMTKQLQMTMFLKNLSMLGGAMLICYFGAGPFSIDSQLKNGNETQKRNEI